MSLQLSSKFEEAVRLMSKWMPTAEETPRKPVLFHGVRVGTYLYDNGYSEDIVIAGLLHDILEDTDITEKELEESFGSNVLKLVQASTKNKFLPKDEQIDELIKRCAANGKDALIVKSADILDSFKWYTSQNNTNELSYCSNNTELIFNYKDNKFSDTIFTELTIWNDKSKALLASLKQSSK